MSDRVPLDAVVWANILTRPLPSAIVLGTAVGLPAGAFFSVVLPEMMGVLGPQTVLPAWARVALCVPAGWIAMYLELTKPY